MQIDYNSLITKGITTSNCDRRTNSFSNLNSFYSPNISENAYSVKISNEAKIENIKSEIKNPNFPPENAPEGVKVAWESVTLDARIPDNIKAIIIRGPFAAAEASANIKYSSDGTPVGIYEKGEKGYVDIYSEPKFTYRGLIDKILNDLDKAGGTSGNEYYEATKKFLNDLDQAFIKNGIV
ncbi:MAG: hypothetical protein FP814_11900 [Desulfobacterium sp.]|nr:hypothetical protein [Desulfobacterium sp.]MBU3950367.1 hypothetical protein [Pseudomonadota bacterium]MBU4010151.1 hypothetical protein [Pseudomonadota bacterium]MBU4035195.1 hypothetical protein [Pseudomonadota bacterium]